MLEVEVQGVAAQADVVPVREDGMDLTGNKKMKADFQHGQVQGAAAQADLVPARERLK